MRKPSSSIQRIAVKKTITVGVRTNRKGTCKIGEPFTYDKVTYKNIKHRA
jgi:hypothetical protein